MPLLPNAGRAVLDERKVRDYLLEPSHPRGQHKARLFVGTLGYRREDHRGLIEEIHKGILHCEAVAMDSIPHGQRFRVDLPITGPAGTSVVRTLCIVRTNEDVPRFTSAYPTRQPARP